MSVGKDNASYLFPVFEYIGEVRYYEVNPQHVFFREHETSIYDDHVLTVLKHGHVHPYFFNPSERDNRKHAIHCLLQTSIIWPVHASSVPENCLPTPELLLAGKARPLRSAFNSFDKHFKQCLLGV